MILGEIRRLTKFASRHEDEFVKAVIGYARKAWEARWQMKKNQLNAFAARDKELDTLFARMYEHICCKGRMSNPSNTVKAAGSSVAV